MTHTPTPWRLGEASNEYQSIVCDDNANGVTLWLANADARGNVAAHIVKCVNLHDQMLITIGKLASGMKRGDEGWSKLDEEVYQLAMEAPHA
jgi:hypothetical protein